MSKQECVTWALGILCLAGTTRAADVPGGIAVVDMSRLLMAHPDAKAADDLLEKQAEEFDAEKSDLVKRFNAMRDEFEASREEARNTALSEAGREKKREEARDKLEALQDFERDVRATTLKRQKQLGEQGERMRRRIVQKIIDVIDAYAAEKGYAVVLDTSSRGLSAVESVVYFRTTLDITEAVLPLLAAQKRDASADSGDGALDGKKKSQ